MTNPNQSAAAEGGHAFIAKHGFTETRSSRQMEFEQACARVRWPSAPSNRFSLDVRMALNAAVAAIGRLAQVCDMVNAVDAADDLCTRAESARARANDLMRAYDRETDCAEFGSEA